MKLRSQRALTERCRPAGRAAGGGAGGTAAPDGSRAAPRDLPVRDGGEGGARSSQQRHGSAVRCERPSARGGKAERCATKAEAGGRARRSSARSDAGSERGKRRRAARGDREAAGVQNEAPCEEAARVRHGQAVAELRAPPAAAGTQCVPAGQRPEPQPGAPQTACRGGRRARRVEVSGRALGRHLLCSAGRKAAGGRRGKRPSRGIRVRGTPQLLAMSRGLLTRKASQQFKRHEVQVCL